ncbi:PEP-CTERM system histidine kinase PrsK [Pseudodesulfovibrio cashew]|uniref:histidine kinase n=1 Tax=Pseudodesulfovibrio cashew TaxID=2678688 RepID=A0A6I6JAT7_9BACT|nr:XrtA/PEP-CTERM system histidine kinase PrsK [Pseudodesulfovibrio cashew]QGY39181.1 PEP-CTERM system histidine kinase PrsK [Pseudodesulfovibrio cashew]
MLSDVVQIAAIASAILFPPVAIIRAERKGSAVAFLILSWLVAALGVVDYMLLKAPADFMPISHAGLYCMALFCPVSILFSNVYCREFSFSSLSSTQRLLLAFSLVPLALVALFPVHNFYYSPDFYVEKVLFLEPVAFFFYLQIILFLAVSLFNLEATLANAPHGVKWKIKFAIVGAGTVITCHVLYYSQSIIFRAIDTGYLATRAAGVLMGLAMVVYSEMRRGSEERIVISKSMAYRSLVVLFCALFLVAVGLVGEGIKLFGDKFNTYAVSMVAFIGVLGLIIVVLSESMRRKFRLAIQRHFYGEKYDYRIEWKKFTDKVTNSRSREELFQNILVLYCETFGVVGGCIFLLGRHSTDYVPISFHEMDESKLVVPAKSPLVRKLKSQKRLLDLRRETPDLGGELEAFLREGNASFIVPIYTADSLVGFIVLSSAINKSETYDEEDRELMEAVARQAAAVLMNMRLGDELAEARDMEAFGKVAAFVLHDLKNQVYPLSLLEANAREYINDPEFQQDMLDSLGNIVGRMNTLIAQLTNIPSKGSLSLKKVDLLTVAREAAELIPSAEIDFIGKSVWVAIDVEEFKKVALNLYLNAMEAGNNARFQVHVDDEDGPVMKVVDFGSGIDEEVLEGGLFVPFKTTKKKGMGIGLYQSKQIMEAHGGSIVASSPEEGGAIFCVTLPPVDAEA